VLEVQDNAYTKRFGAAQVSASTVVDIDSSNQRATLVDLEAPTSLTADTYDCTILTQTLHLLRRPAGVRRHLRRSSCHSSSPPNCG
jgi:hypothetical protein